MRENRDGGSDGTTLIETAAVPTGTSKNRAAGADFTVKTTAAVLTDGTDSQLTKATMNHEC